MSRLLAFLAVVLALSGCASTTGTSSTDGPDTRLKGDEVVFNAVIEQPAVAARASSEQPGLAPRPKQSDVPSSPSRFATGIAPLGQGLRLEQLTETKATAPMWVDLPSIDVERAPISAVGVEANGDMEIPGAEEVGWYRFGPTPGDLGSSVLAAHIAFDGQDGVFRDLSDMEPGDEFAVGMSDGSSRSFVVIGLRQYAKTDIPLEDFFSRAGTPRLILITCGGSFNRDLRSYDDNVVVVAVPLDFLLGGEDGSGQDG